MVQWTSTVRYEALLGLVTSSGAARILSPSQLSADGAMTPSVALLLLRRIKERRLSLTRETSSIYRVAASQAS
jgi:hypothetical protein